MYCQLSGTKSAISTNSSATIFFTSFGRSGQGPDVVPDPADGFEVIGANAEVTEVVTGCTIGARLDPVENVGRIPRPDVDGSTPRPAVCFVFVTH